MTFLSIIYITAAITIAVSMIAGVAIYAIDKSAERNDDKDQ